MGYNLVSTMNEFVALLCLLVAVVMLAVTVMAVSLMVRVFRYTHEQSTKLTWMMTEMQRQGRLMGQWTEDGLPVRTPRKPSGHLGAGQQ
jgi:Tfp pilus assembly protein PilV